MYTIFNVQEPYKSLILSGKKTIEDRLNKGKFAQLKIGDFFQFEESGEILEIKNLTLYPSFKAMLEQKGIKHVLPGTQSIEEGIAIYHQFYTPEQETQFGVIAIEIKKVA